jgi:RloB-like protein
MTLVHRKRRPLIRDGDSFRDDRLFIVACDDTFAPEQYFRFFRISRVQVHVITTTDGTSSAPHVLNRLLEIDHIEDDERWLLLDVDHCLQATHTPTFLEAIRRAKSLGVKVALSKPCFELWLLLHHVEPAEVTALAHAREVEAKLRQTLGAYNKTHISKTDFPLSSVAQAYARARELDVAAASEIPMANSSHVYKLWEAIVAGSLQSQLPSELALMRGTDR